MTATAHYSRLVPIHVKVGESGILLATSPTLPGLLASAHTRDELYANLPRWVEALYEATGERVIVSLVGPEDLEKVVVWPLDAAKAAVERAANSLL